MKEKLKPWATEQAMTVLVAGTSVLTVLYLISLSVKHSFLFLTGIILVAYFFFFLIAKEGLSEKQKPIMGWVVLAEVGLYLSQGINAPLFSLFFKPDLLPQQTIVAWVMIGLANLLVGSLYLYGILKPNAREKWSLLLEKELLAPKASEKPQKPGDVILCYDFETKEPVWWRIKDRFLHLLILGPTGSGKTSQTLYPVILQDLKNEECGITVIEPKGDMAEKVYFMAKEMGRTVTYFNPTLPDCPYFNPLYGKEDIVIENITTTFRMLTTGNSSSYFLDLGENLLRNSIKLLKRLKGNDCTFIDLYTLIANVNNQGQTLVNELGRMKITDGELKKENEDIISYFKNDYFAERSKVFQDTSDIRTKVSKITSNKYLRRVLNPPAGRNDVKFAEHLESNHVYCIATAQGKLRDLGSYLGYFLILQLQSATFNRPGNEDTRRHHFLYIDEFQKYANPGYEDMLTQGRSYRVASHLATQNRALLGSGGSDGDKFIKVVSSNARNIILYPGGNGEDADYYSKEFGEIETKKTEIGISRKKFSLARMFEKSSGETESIREVEKLEKRFTMTDIIYQPFGTIIYRIISNNSIQFPQLGEIEFIPKDLNERLDEQVFALHKELAELEEESDKRDAEKLNPQLVDEAVESVVIVEEGKSVTPAGINNSSPIVSVTQGASSGFFPESAKNSGLANQITTPPKKMDITGFGVRSDEKQPVDDFPYNEQVTKTDGVEDDDL